MDKLEVFNRASGTWESNFDLITGWNENFVTDKTTDSGKIKLKYKGLEYPNWENGDWCRFIHTANGSVSYTKGNIAQESIFVINNLQVDRTFTTSGNQITGFNIVFSLIARTDVNMVFNVPISIGFIFHITKNDTEQQQLVYNVVIPANQSSVTLSIEMNIGDGTEQPSVYNGSYVEITNITPSKASIAETTTAEYYLPKDHAQYLIANLNMVKDIENSEIDIQFDLIEPIEYLKGVVLETRSLSRQVSKIIDNNNYVHEDLTYYTALEILLKTTPANNDISKSWWSRIKIADADILNAKSFTDVTYSEQTLYSILMDKFDAALGMTPVLYFDIDGTTDLPYNLDRAEYILKFERQDGADKQSITLNTLRENSNQETFSKSFENFAKGLVINYDNLISQTKNEILQDKVFAMPEIDGQDRYLSSHTSQNGDWVIRTPHSIKNVTKVIGFNVKNVYHSSGAGYMDYETETIEFRNIFTENQYNASLMYGDENAIWFVEGENVVHINKMAYTTVSNTASSNLWVFYVEYEPLVNGRIELGEEYFIPVNQVDGQVNSYELGKYLKQYLASMNKADLTISKTVSDYAEIYSRGTRVYDGEKMYLITNVSVQNRNQDYEVVYQLNENHFRKNDSIEAPQQARRNIEIGIDATKERKSCLVDKYYIGIENNNKQITHTITDDAIKMYSPLIYQSNMCPKIAELKFKDKLNLLWTLRDETSYSTRQIDNFEVEEVDWEKTLSCEIVKFISADAIWFNVRYYDNAEAGKKKVLQKYNKTLYPVFPQDYYYGCPEQQIPIIYTNGFGEFKNFDVALCELSENQTLMNYKLSGNNWQDRLIDLNKNVMPQILNSANYPEYDIAGEEYFKVEDINYYKQRLETFNYSIGVRYESDRKIILCEDFFKLNNLMQEEDASADKIRVYSKNINEQDFLTATADAEVSITDKSIVGQANGYDLEFTLQSNITNPKCIAFVSKIGTPLLIIQDYDIIRTGEFNTIKLFCQ